MSLIAEYLGNDKTKDFDEILGPIPSNKSLFKNKHFIITCTIPMKEPRTEIKEVSFVMFFLASLVGKTWDKHVAFIHGISFVVDSFPESFFLLWIRFRFLSLTSKPNTFSCQAQDRLKAIENVAFCPRKQAIRLRLSW